MFLLILIIIMIGIMFITKVSEIVLIGVCYHIIMNIMKIAK